MQTWPRLAIIIPLGPNDGLLLIQLLQSIYHQTYPKDRINVRIITEGNSEEAKALGILRTRQQVEVVALFCADNELLEPDYLSVLVRHSTQSDVVGAYTHRYAYCRSDRWLSRYFALLGANDPLCWWLGKADRASYLNTRPVESPRRFSTPNLPSLGDNGCFYQAKALQELSIHPSTFGSCMCLCQDLWEKGYQTWAVVPTHATWHKTGERFWGYLTRRTFYVKTLYLNKRRIRRWHQVRTLRDWTLVVLFAVASLLVLPQVFVSLLGARRVRDWAWAAHPLICWFLTLSYTWVCLTSAWSFRPWTDHTR